jgi:hypothetical protein
MKLRYLLVGWLLSILPATAQTLSGVLHPAQTITLGTRTKVGGTIALPNHNLVLLLTSSETPEVTAQCLAPDGHTLWQTTMTRFQHIDTRYMRESTGWTHRVFDTQAAPDNRELSSRQVYDAERSARLSPLQVVTDGNTLVLAERIGRQAAKNQPKGNAIKLREGQLLVQRLDEQGHLTKHLFEPAAAPDPKQPEPVPLGRYADAAGYVELLREPTTADETATYYALHYDLQTQATRREALSLPATPARPGTSNAFHHYYQGWAYLGHRLGQTYFCRRTLVATPQDKPGQQPLAYQVFIADDHGVPATPSGFTTTLGLPKGTRVGYSGNLSGTGEISYLPVFYQQRGAGTIYEFEEWNVTTGGMGSFYLDHASGDILIFGEYGAGDLPGDGNLALDGFFMRRYAPDGRVLAQTQIAYTPAMRAGTRTLTFKGRAAREVRFHADPLTGQYQYGFAPVPYYGTDEDFDLFLAPDLILQRYEYLSDKKKDTRWFTSVTFAQPFALTLPYGNSSDQRTYEQAASTDLPVYSALAQLRRAAPADAEYHRFYVSATGPSTGLVVEQPLGLGGTLKVYTF